MKGALFFLAAAQVVMTVFGAPLVAERAVDVRAPEKLGEDILLSLVGAYSDEKEGSDVAKRSQLAEDNIIFIVLAYQNETESSAKMTKRAPEKLGEDILLSLVRAYSDEKEGSDVAKRNAVTTKRSQLAEDNIIFIVLAYQNETERSAEAPAKMLKRIPEKLGEDILLSLVGAYSDEVEGSDVAKRSNLPKTISAKRSELAADNIIFIVLAYDGEGTDVATKSKREAFPDKLGEDILLSLVGAYSDEVKGSDVAKRAEESIDIITFTISAAGKTNAYADDIAAADEAAVLGL